jgi:hypothetical protein
LDVESHAREKTVVVIGLREIGRPLLELVSRRHWAIGVDRAPLGERLPHVDMMHICYPFEMHRRDGPLHRGVQSPSDIPLEEASCQRKVDTILESFASQRGKRWFSEELFRSLLRIRGMERNAPSNYAEAFYCRTLTVG